jgi:hypothetical protein
VPRYNRQARLEMNQQTQTKAHETHFASTTRNDLWWVEPVSQGLGFLAFVVYTTWAMFQANHYFSAPYLSPLYSPPLFIDPSAAGSAPIEHALFGTWPSWWPSFLPASPAMLILMGPLSFRLTCYYYRKFYYRSFFASPPACSVTALPQKNYKGETGLLVIQNIHRYTLYIAIGYIILLAYDAFHAFFKNGQFGIGVGTIVLWLNVILLSAYTLGCHAFRHLIGGRLDCFSCSASQEHSGFSVWKKVSILNGNHMLWAWLSMIWVGFTDLYVRMVSMGIWHDFNTWGN